MIALISLIAIVSAGKLHFDSCQNKIREIDLEISQTGDFSNWSVISGARGKIYQKKCGLKSNVFDMEFCTTVCELNEEESCKVNPQVGDDVCAPGLICNNSVCESYIGKFENPQTTLNRPSHP